MSKLFVVCLALVGLINLAPVAGLFSAQRLAAAYGLEVMGPDLEILLRHRALLFGILGGFILCSIVVPSLQGAAMLMAAVSMVGFALVTWSVGGYNEALTTVLRIDLLGLLFLSAAAVIKFGFMEGQ